MISARDFCKEPGYSVAIFLTYAFDPLFFERIPYEDLGVGGTRRILVLGDASEIGGAIQRCAGQIFHLGRKYTLAEANPSNLFHPKLMVRLSPEGGKVWIGSGNLTYTGWGGNHELAVAWPIGPGSTDSGAWLFDILRSVASLTGAESFRSQIEEVGASLPWLRRAASEAAATPVLLGMPGRPLAPQLARRWSGRRFATLKMYTGSTDVDGAFLRWAHDTFGVKKATICVTPSFASFDAKQLAKLPLDVRFVQRDPKRRMHAKLCWFSGSDGDAAVMGSANCSAAAWLANHANGNIELITVYDTPDRAAFVPLLTDFDGEEHLPEDVLTAPVKLEELPGNAADGEIYRLTSLRLRESGRTIEAVVEPTPDQDSATLVFEIDRKKYRVPMKRSNNRFTGRLSEEISLGAETVFGTMEIPSNADVIVTQSRWLDNDRAIENGARGRETDPNHSVFSGRGFAGASEQRIMEAIYSISTSLFNCETPDLSDLGPERREPNEKETGADEDEEAAGPVDPSKLTYRISDQAGKHVTNAPGQHKMHGVSLSGIIALLFSSEDDPEVDLSQERWGADEPEQYEDGATSGMKPTGTPPPPEQTPVPRSDAEAMATLRREIEAFLFGLAKPSFAERCPPATLAQALVFPILLGAKGSEEGWLQDDALASIACRVVQIMFSKPYGPGKPKGLFRQVQTRYATGEPREEFLKFVGDGALNTVLLAALAKPEARSVGALVQQADAISQVERCTDLVAMSHPDQKTMLSQNVIIRGATFAISERAPVLAQAMAKLTACLQQWDRANPGRAGRSALHKAGSVLWMSHGWEVMPRSPAETYCSGMDLGTIATHDADIQSALDDLWLAMRLGRNAHYAVSTVEATALQKIAVA
ncbi:hypothetical protein LPW26_16790 [Rhodopseudomonas sp. HC1]|uniref:hypothetical protein n=1 Tax=Rhodopseudomonas infernalis TaxID=2897386 RepID=UPI001EE8F712|nr:hypothetical protein [Rhodopseudomonas infernalis]MCG6206308.1 hypothetical protein [Rhodopseudomonas infernalis]